VLGVEPAKPAKLRFRPSEDAPTVHAFLKSKAIIRGIRGPVGSGKSVGCCWGPFLLGQLQAPDSQGVRRVRSAILRNTYPELLSTSIETWNQWFGPLTKWTYSAPIRGLMRFRLRDGTMYEHQLIAVSADRDQDIAKLKSLELTFAWVNEASEIPRSIIDMLAARIWRYPPTKDGAGASYSCIFMDTNAPPTTHWWYRLAEEKNSEEQKAILAAMEDALRKEGFDYPVFEFFAQPPAILEHPERPGAYLPNPAAENVKHQKLGAAYWLMQVPEKKKEWIRVFLQGQYGSIATGRVVYPEYRDEVHCAAKDNEPDPTLPLLLGWDFWHNPALAIAQVMRNGQLRIYDEVIGTSIGVRTFVREIAVPFLKTFYGGMAVQSWGDPSGSSRHENMETTSIREVEEAGIPIKPAWTNEFLARKEAVSGFLLRMTSDGEPAFQLNPRCKTLRTGFISGYQVEKLQVIARSDEEERYRDEPVKNMWSHIHEALQYGVLDYDRRFERARRDLARKKSGIPARAPGGPADKAAGY
jgi:hypothetical protein